MELDFVSCIEKYDDFESTYLHLLEKTLNLLKVKCDPLVSISIVDNEFIHKLNKEYRQIDRPTDVISFAFLDGEKDKTKILNNLGFVSLGDIYISYEKAEEQATDYGHSIKREFSFLFVHGLLHLLGYDHTNEEDEKVMFALQDDILRNEVF